MPGSDTHRIVSKIEPDGTTHIAVLRRSADSDQLSDEEIIAKLEEWRARPRLRAIADD